MKNKLFNIICFVSLQIARLQNSERYKKSIALKRKLDEQDCSLNDSEKKYFRQFLNTHLCKVFNYSFAYKYDLAFPKIYSDKENGLKYVITSEKHRLYFKRNMTTAQIRKMYNALCAEQDLQSPHCYIFCCEPKENTVLADIGTAEGNFALKFIERFGKVYLFECDVEWLEALQATFNPWVDKVEIIKTYVSDINDADNVSLDHYFTNKEMPTLLKMDVEGYEEKVLTGANKLINNAKPELLVCTYHCKNDDKKLSTILINHNYDVEFSNGWMIFENDFRKGILHAGRKI
jgi:precorrin-6B methylase 2